MHQLKKCRAYHYALFSVKHKRQFFVNGQFPCTTVWAGIFTRLLFNCPYPISAKMSKMSRQWAFEFEPSFLCVHKRGFIDRNLGITALLEILFKYWPTLKIICLWWSIVSCENGIHLLEDKYVLCCICNGEALNAKDASQGNAMGSVLCKFRHNPYQIKNRKKYLLYGKFFVSAYPIFSFNLLIEFLCYFDIFPAYKLPIKRRPIVNCLRIYVLYWSRLYYLHGYRAEQSRIMLLPFSFQKPEAFIKANE